MQRHDSLSLFDHIKSNMQEAGKIALIIEHDIIQGVFDIAVSKYKLKYLQKENYVKLFHKHLAHPVSKQRCCA